MSHLGRVRSLMSVLTRKKTVIVSPRPRHQMTTEAEKQTKTDFWNLDFNVGKSQRYYSKRREFFERLVFVTEFGTAVSGTFAFVALLNSFPTIAIWLTGIVSFLGIANMIAHFGDRAKSSDGLYREYAKLAVDISKAGRNDEAALKSITIRRAKIVVIEKRSLAVIEAEAYNEEIVSRGRGLRYQLHIRWYQKPLGHFVTLWPDRFDPIGTGEPR